MYTNLLHHYFIIIICLTITLASCTRKVNSNASKEEGHCQTIDHSIFEELHVPTKNIFTIVDSSLLKHYPYKTLLLANATGILPYLTQYQQVKYNIKKDTSTKSEYWEIRGQIEMKLLQTMSLIQSISSELDCEAERSNLAADYLEDKENKRAKVLTVLSITTAAAVSIISAIIKNIEISDGVEITGGVTSAFFGILTLKRMYQIKYQQKRNLLADIWYAPDSSEAYPPAIWYILNRKEFNFPQNESILEHTQSQWKLYGERIKDKNKTDYILPTIYFDDEALYNFEELRNRAKMVNQLQAQIRLINQELQILIVRIEN
mgnify:CR=1 FL=1